MRTLTPEAARAILARETSEAFLALRQITGPGLGPIRIVNNTEAITMGPRPPDTPQGDRPRVDLTPCNWGVFVPGTLRRNTWR